MATSTLGLVKSAIIAGLSLAGAWQAYDFALVPNLRLSSPDLALAYWPHDAVSLSRRVNAKVKEAQAYVSDPSDASEAVRSLVDTPLSRSSLRIIGMDAAQRGNSDVALSAMSLSHRLSRRDPWTEVWLLEHAAREEDYEGILTHYNAALAVNPEFAPALNPILVTATASPQIRLPLKQYLRANAPWAPGYLASASKEADLDDLLELVLPISHHLRDDAFTPAISTIVYRLAGDGRWDEAMRLADATWSDFNAADFSRFAPTPASADERLGRLAWQLSGEQGVVATLVGDEEFDVSLSPLARGTVASRDIRIQGPGQYALTQRVEFGGRWQSSRIRWLADCISGSSGPTTRVWEQTIPAASKPAAYRSTISVNGGCTLLRLTLVGTGPDGQSEATISVKGLEFVRAR